MKTSIMKWAAICLIGCGLAIGSVLITSDILKLITFGLGMYLMGIGYGTEIRSD